LTAGEQVPHRQTFARGVERSYSTIRIPFWPMIDKPQERSSRTASGKRITASTARHDAANLPSLRPIKHVIMI
jgi:hypothetical protein